MLKYQKETYFSIYNAGSKLDFCNKVRGFSVFTAKLKYDKSAFRMSLKHFPELSDVLAVLGAVYCESDFVEKTPVLFIDQDLPEILRNVLRLISKGAAAPCAEDEIPVSVICGDQEKYPDPP